MMERLNELSEILAILSAMIAPVVLISAGASLTISTANRLARAVERTRNLLKRYEELAKTTVVDESAEAETMMLYDELLLSTRRSRLLQRALASLYLTISTFVAASVVLGVVAIVDRGYSWMPLLLIMLGAGLLFYSSVLLIAEVYLTRQAINIEMDFILSRTRHHASPAVQDYQLQKKPAMKEAQS
jgi:hypothetical protein